MLLFSMLRKCCRLLEHASVQMYSVLLTWDSPRGPGRSVTNAKSCCSLAKRIHHLLTRLLKWHSGWSRVGARDHPRNSLESEHASRKNGTGQMVLFINLNRMAKATGLLCRLVPGIIDTLAWGRLQRGLRRRKSETLR